MGQSVKLPEGFTLDQPKGLPQGFMLDAPMSLAEVSARIPGGQTSEKTKAESEGTNTREVFTKQFNRAVGDRVGLDNPEAYGKYAGLANVPATAFDVLMGVGQGMAFALPQGQADLGNISDAEANQIGRDLMAIGESAGIVTGVTPTISAPNVARTARPISKLGENVRVLEDVGVDPSLALASESGATRSLAAGVENTFAGGPLQKGNAKAYEDIANTAEDLINQVGTPSDDVGIGQLVRSGLKRYATSIDEGADIAKPARETSIASKAKALYDRAGIDEATTIKPVNTANSILPVVTKYSDEAFSSVFKNTNMRKIAERLNEGVDLSYADLKQLRRDVWKLQRQQDLTANIDSKDIGNLYNGITKDLEIIAESQGKLNEFRRAEQFWAKSQERITKSLQRFAGEKMSDEQIYNRIAQSVKEGSTGNIKSLRALRNSLRQEEWGDVAATVFNRLGLKDDVFNVNQFITNYSKMSPQARTILTSHKPGLRPAFESLAKATKLLQRYDRARPRGSSPTQNALGTMATGAGTAEAILSGGIPWFTSLAAGGTWMTAKMLSSPRFVRLLARTKRIEAQAAQGKDIAGPVQDLTRDLYLISASDDIAASDVERLLSTFGPERAAAKEEDKNQSK